jgi:hypothetical protein
MELPPAAASPAHVLGVGGLCGLMLLCVVGTCWADTVLVSPLDGIKKLQGSWAIVSNGKTLSIRTTYQLASADTIAAEQFGRVLWTTTRSH